MADEPLGSERAIAENRDPMQVSQAEIDVVLRSTDAKVWAEAFMKVMQSGVQIDEGLMITWFANAIETGKRG
jgi:hypothetical protein